MSRYFAQFGTDRLIESYFEAGHVGTCIEVGAVDGIQISNTAHFEMLGWRCMCIEPQPGPGYFADLARNRKLALNCAISSENADDILFHVVYCNGQAWNGMSGLQLDERLIDQHRALGFDVRVETIRVPTRRLDWCIERYFNHSVIDFISIDVEGTELDVLKSFDVAGYNTTLYVVENNFNDADIGRYMKNAGYRLDRRVEVNDFYVRA
jgi:FkbM family methyltransferase